MTDNGDTGAGVDRRRAAGAGCGAPPLPDLSEAAAAAGLLDVAYATLDSPVGQILLAMTPRGLVRLAYLGDDSEESVLEDLAIRISPRVLAAPRRLDEPRRELDSTSPGAGARFELALDWQLARRVRPPRAAGDRADPVRLGLELQADRHRCGQPARLPSRRQRPRIQPAADHRPLPPGPARRRRPRRLHRRAGAQAGVAGGRGVPRELSALRLARRAAPACSDCLSEHAHPSMGYHLPVDLMRPVRAFDRRQQTRPWLAIPVAVFKKFSDDQAGGLAALIAYYAFFSLFPLLLVFVTVLGFVLQGDPAAQESIRNSVLAQFPVIGTQLQGRAAAWSHGGARDRLARGALGGSRRHAGDPERVRQGLGGSVQGTARLPAPAVAGICVRRGTGDPVPDLVGRLRVGQQRPRRSRVEDRRDRAVPVAQLRAVRRRVPVADLCHGGRPRACGSVSWSAA